MKIFRMKAVTESDSCLFGQVGRGTKKGPTERETQVGIGVIIYAETISERENV